MLWMADRCSLLGMLIWWCEGNGQLFLMIICLLTGMTSSSVGKDSLSDTSGPRVFFAGFPLCWTANCLYLLLFLPGFRCDPGFLHPVRSWVLLRTFQSIILFCLLLKWSGLFSFLGLHALKPRHRPATIGLVGFDIMTMLDSAWMCGPTWLVYKDFYWFLISVLTGIKGNCGFLFKLFHCVLYLIWFNWFHFVLWFHNPLISTKISLLKFPFLCVLGYFGVFNRENLGKSYF